MSRYSFFDIDKQEPIEEEEIIVTFSCEFCGNGYELDIIETHRKNCNKNPINLEKCKYCTREIFRRNILNHELNCKKNPANIVREIELSDSETQKITTDYLRFISGLIYDTTKFGKDINITKQSIIRGNEKKSALYIIKYLTNAYNLERSLRALIKEDK